MKPTEMLRQYIRAEHERSATPGFVLGDREQWHAILGKYFPGWDSLELLTLDYMFHDTTAFAEPQWEHLFPED